MHRRLNFQHQTLLGPPNSLDLESLRFKPPETAVDICVDDPAPRARKDVIGMSDISLRTHSHSPMRDIMASPAKLVSHLQGRTHTRWSGVRGKAWDANRDELYKVFKVHKGT